MNNHMSQSVKTGDVNVSVTLVSYASLFVCILFGIYMFVSFVFNMRLVNLTKHNNDQLEASVTNLTNSMYDVLNKELEILVNVSSESLKELSHSRAMFKQALDKIDRIKLEETLKDKQLADKIEETTNKVKESKISIKNTTSPFVFTLPTTPVEMYTMTLSEKNITLKYNSDDVSESWTLSSSSQNDMPDFISRRLGLHGPYHAEFVYQQVEDTNTQNGIINLINTTDATATDDTKKPIPLLSCTIQNGELVEIEYLYNVDTCKVFSYTKNP